MYINILSTVENIEAVRKKAKEVSVFENHSALTIGASPTGDLPATHWFCTFNASEEVYNEIMALQELAIVEKTGPKTFLQNHGLKMIKAEKFIEAKAKGQLDEI